MTEPTTDDIDVNTAFEKMKGGRSRSVSTESGMRFIQISRPGSFNQTGAIGEVGGPLKRVINLHATRMGAE